eukprot:GHRR01011425.1.p1 GENE.GHRR01011425.1~~GHRR01011425.1.p1  ORF type:complete len:268 (+),score=57.00 GHRR01011425.1:50-853(+)
MLARSHHARQCSVPKSRCSSGRSIHSWRPAVGRKIVVAVVAHGHGHGVASATDLKKQGFVGEMRRVAMKLHTKEQAPKEGGIEAPKQKRMPPTLKGYQQFLAESKVVYETFEQIMQEAAYPEYAKFQNTGLERSAALAADLDWMQEQYSLPAPAVQEDGPGNTYRRQLLQLAKDDPQSFICHYYNFYFAHTAGGRMIGKQVANMLLGGKELKFYHWDGDMNQLLDTVRNTLNKLAESWTREQKDHCLEETMDAFKWSGGLLQCITQE